MVSEKDKKIWKVSIGLGLYHILLHFVGINFYADPKDNFLYFVTPGLIISYYIYKKFIE